MIGQTRKADMDISRLGEISWRTIFQHFLVSCILLDIDMHDSEHFFRYWTISSVSISLEFL